MCLFSQHPSILLFFFSILIFPTTPTSSANDTPAYSAVDLILLTCGSLLNVTDTIGRNWNFHDDGYITEYSNGRPASSSLVDYRDSSLPVLIPFQTARVFEELESTYNFHVSRGQKFVRLYFYPINYLGINIRDSNFSVTANGFTLLSNFNAFLHSQPKHLLLNTLMKEFIVNVTGDGMLNLTFSPYGYSPSSSEYGYLVIGAAFINGIEIVSLPDNLYFQNSLKQFVETSDLETYPALETLYRLNIGGPDVQIQDDSGPIRGMFRLWSQDDPYLSFGDPDDTPHVDNHAILYTNQTPPYSAPEIVYRTSRVATNTSLSLRWKFPVDSGFHYLLRLHFCENQLQVIKMKPSERAFSIQINDEIVETEADVMSWTGGTGIPIFRDYTASVPDDGRRGKQDLRLSIFRNNERLPKYSSALLSGLEIFKISDLNRSLAAANPEFVPLDAPSPMNLALKPSNSLPTENKKKRGFSVIFAVIGSVIGILAVIAMLSFLIFGRRRKVRKPTTAKPLGLAVTLPTTLRPKISGSHGSLLSDLCRHFTLKEMKMATANFDDSFVIGRGGFGNVYKGFIDSGTTAVAVKRLHSSSNQGAQEFLTEIELLSRLRHLHLVSLIGYCDEKGEMILAYDYMPQGTLRDHLYNSNNPPLMWKHRLQICLGAAKGLDYLHTSTKHAIIHRDVKSTNILLDEKWVAKVSDFGLSKIGPSDAANTHITTAVKGSFGYLDPEYYKRHKLTDKSDVYSFGVVLFEVLCGRPAILPCSQTQEPDEQVNLAEWANYCYEKGTIDQIVDSNMDKDQIAPECLNKFVETAITCVRGSRIERPAMSDVVRSLELAMQLQEAAEGGNGAADATSAFELEGEAEAYASNNGGVQYVEAFSELVNPAGR